MANPWFRLYSEFATDPKVQMLSEAYQRRLVMVFCLRSNDVITGNDEEIAFSLRIDSQELEKTKETFIRKGFIDSSWNILNWEKRQFLSDSSNSRVAKYREKRKEMGITSNGYTKHAVTVKERDGNCCVYCGSIESLCIDHVLPVMQGGNDDIENLVCSCKECNSGKSGRTPEQAGYTFKNKISKDRWELWLKEKHVTVTVTPPDTEQIQNRTDTEQIQSKSKAIRASRFDAQAHLLSLGVDIGIAEDWIQHRKAKKAVVTETAIAGIEREASKAGYSLSGALAECCAKGWTGFNADWVKKNGTHKNIHDQRAETIAILTGRKNAHGSERDITGESQRVA